MADIEKIKIGNTEYNVKDVTSGYITGIDSTDVTDALGYTPYSSSNPNGYTSNVGTVTSVNSVTPDASGDVTLSIPTVNNATLTVTQNGTSKGTFTANSSTDTTIALTDTTYSVFTGANGSAAGTTGLVPQPSATDNTKFLKGDGTWGTVDALPSQTSQSGKYLTTNGTTASWSDVPEEIAFVEYDVTSFADVITAFESGKTVICKQTHTNDTQYFNLITYLNNGPYYLAFIFEKGDTQLYVNTEDDSTVWTSVTNKELPSQSGNNGKLLTTDGLSASWASLKTINSSSLIGTGNISITGLPSQTSQSGKYLTTDGSSASWASISIPTVDQTYDGTSSNAQSGVAIAGAGFLDNKGTGTNSLAIMGTATGNRGVGLGQAAEGTGAYSSGLGTGAKATGNYSIQIGYGTNSTASTLSVGFNASSSSDRTNWELLDGSTGLIPDARISNNIVKTVNSTSPDANGNVSLTIPVVDQTYNSSSSNAQSGAAIAGAGFLTNTAATGTDSLTIEGTSTDQNGCINIGYGSSITKNSNNDAVVNSIAIGNGATITPSDIGIRRSIAIGKDAVVNASDSIQLGYGTNSTDTSFAVGFMGTNYTLLDGTTGLIPDERISSNIARASAIPVVDQTYDATSANAQSGVAISGAKFIQNKTGGFNNINIGDSLTIGDYSENTIVLGNNATSTTSSQNSVAIGEEAKVGGVNSVVIGYKAEATGSYNIAIGNNAKFSTASVNSAIQLGSGTNSTSNTFKVGNYTLLDTSTGLIPDARISSNIARTSQIPAGLPSQTGHSGDILTTDGTDASWADTAQVYPIIETYVNGNDWYRIWAPDSTGYRWCEQGSLYYKGSTMAGTDNTITFLKTFKDVNYTFLALPIHSAANANGYSSYEKYASRTVGSTILRMVGPFFGYSWVAKGYIADEAS